MRVPVFYWWQLHIIPVRNSQITVIFLRNWNCHMLELHLYRLKKICILVLKPEHMPGELSFLPYPAPAHIGYIVIRLLRCGTLGVLQVQVVQLRSCETEKTQQASRLRGSLLAANRPTRTRGALRRARVLSGAGGHSPVETARKSARTSAYADLSGGPNITLFPSAPGSGISSEPEERAHASSPLSRFSLCERR